MNIHDVNNPLISGDPSKGKRVSDKRETDRTDKTTGRIRTQQESDIQSSQDVPVKQVRDTFVSTENRKFAADLTNMIEGSEPEPREDAVTRAKERIQAGFYNSPEFLNRLASTLVNTGVTRL